MVTIGRSDFKISLIWHSFTICEIVETHRDALLRSYHMTMFEYSTVENIRTQKYSLIVRAHRRSRSKRKTHTDIYWYK